MEDMGRVLGEFIRTMKPDEAVVPLVDLWRLAPAARSRLARTEFRPPTKDFHPSSLCDPCMRFDVMQHMIVDGHPGAAKFANLFRWREEDFNFKLQRKFDAGTALHEMEQGKYYSHAEHVIGRWRCSNCGEISKIGPRPTACRNRVIVFKDGQGSDNRKCENHGTWEYKEIRLTNPLGIAGRIDLALDMPGTGVVVVDFKFLGEKRWKMFSEFKEPFSKDVTQLQIYLGCLQDAGAKHGILSYEYMGEPDTKPVAFGVNPKPSVMRSVETYIATVKELAAEGRLTPATMACAKPTASRAVRCPLSTVCFPS